MDVVVMQQGLHRVALGITASVAEAVPAWVTRTTLSRTVIVPLRADVLPFAATVNKTGLSPACGIVVVTVIHDTSD
jgi:hypothetical protein